MKAKRLLCALAIILLGSAFTANAEQIFADIQPEQRNDNVMTVNIYLEGDQIHSIKDRIGNIGCLNDSKFDEMGELSSVEIIYSNIAEKHDAIAERLSSGINALEIPSLINEDEDKNHVEIYAEPSDDPTSQTFKRFVVFVTYKNEIIAILLEGNITMPENLK